MRRAARVAIGLLALLGASGSARAQAFDPDSARAALEQLAAALEENFVYPDVGAAYAQMLRGRIARVERASFGDAQEFAAVVTAELQALSPDAHLRLLPPERDDADEEASQPAAMERARGPGRAEWLSPGVAYLELNGFSGAEDEIARMTDALDRFAGARALILDLRPHDGGGLRETDVLFSYLFEQSTVTIAMDTRADVEARRGAFLRESDTLVRVPGPEGVVRRQQVARPRDGGTLGRVKLFVLVGPATASGGEHVALVLKRTGRGTLIGERTAGAGHFGRVWDLGGGYRAFIPIGRPFDPDTGAGWEATGVTPHIEVPAEQALVVALARAGD